MPRKRQHARLRVHLNNRLVGWLLKEPGGHVEFRYDASWLEGGPPIPVSLSLPLREDAYRGQSVAAVFDNLLPDSETLRRRIAERIGADGVDAYSLLSRIGRDCVGALQFLPEAEQIHAESSAVDGEPVSDHDIERLLENLAQAPLGLDRNQEFRISVAGAQEKTALLFHRGRWLKPRGTTPTTHILKPQIGALPNGIDLSNSVENEFYCLRLLAAFGLRVNAAEIKVFGRTKALVIERFDRLWAKDGRLLRLPQEDCCQALAVPAGRKYQNEGGPGIAEILHLLRGADSPAADQKAFLKAQILFWLLGATDGHARNFSIFLGPGGRFSLTPLYDVLTAQPSLHARQIIQKQMKMAMFVGSKRHYQIRYIKGHHFLQTCGRAGLPPALAGEALEEVAQRAPGALDLVEAGLPPAFPAQIADSVRAGFNARLQAIAT